LTVLCSFAIIHSLTEAPSEARGRTLTEKNVQDVLVIKKVTRILTVILIGVDGNERMSHAPQLETR
jgi:hypothetical protein